MLRWPAVIAAFMTVACIALAAPTAYGQEKDELARRHFESGAAYFAEAEYAEALKAFEKAYELSNRPQILLNISVVQERLGNLRGAVEALDQYVAQNPDDPEIETIRLRRDNLAKRAENQAPQEPTAPAGPATEGAKEPKSPRTPTATPASPPPAEASPRPEQAPSDDVPNRTPAYVLLSVGGLAGIGALVTGWGAQAEYDDLESSCGRSCTDDQTSTGKTLALTSTILSGVAVVAVGIGAALWLSADESSDDAPPVARDDAKLFLGLGPNGGYAEARWSF